MSETPDHETEPTTAPVTTVPPATTYADRPPYVEPAPLRRKPHRLYQAAAWVAIVAGSVFIVAVIFFSGFALGVHSGGGHHGGGHHHGQMGMHQQSQMRPSFIFPSGPGGPFGPGGPGQGGQGNFGPGPGNFGPGQSQLQPGGPQRPS
jgi:hypothetical protein